MRQTVKLFLFMFLLTAIAFAGGVRTDRALDNVEVGGAQINKITSGYVQVPLELSNTAFVGTEYLSNGTLWLSAYTLTAPADVVWLSTDHGATWKKSVVNATKVGIANVAAKDASTAIVGFFNGVIKRTTDGGTTWNQVYSFGDGTQYINGVKFIGPDTAIAIGDADASGIMVAMSTDAGATWTRETFTTDKDSLTAGGYWASYASLGQALDVVGHTIWTTWYFGSSQRPMIMKSTDAGVTWTKWRAVLTDSANNYYFRSINFKDENIGFGTTRRVTSSSNGDYYAVKTTDGGATWSDTLALEAGVPHLNQKVYSVKPIRGTNNVVAVGLNGATGGGSKLWWSTDNGTTWVPKAVPGPSNLNNSAFLTATDGFAVGYKNVLKYVTDNPVTFRVNMRVTLLEKTFRPDSGDVVRVAGDFNGWGGSTDTLRSTGPTDSIYTLTKPLPAGAINYKFLKTPRGGRDWEDDPNRSYTVVDGNQTLPVVYFNRDSVYPKPTPVSVKFQVNMSIKMKEQTFKPGSGDYVFVAGSMNSWSTSADTLRSTGPTDSIYTKTLTIPSGTVLAYKFYKTTRGGLDWENVPNRAYTVPPAGGDIPVVWFDNDSIYNAPVSTNVLWHTDMSAYITLGWFNPAKDSMQVRGGFEGWGGTPMTQNFLTPQIYEKTLSYTGTTGDQLQYKYFIKMDSVSAVARFGAPFASNKDGHQYEHPAEQGDGNNIYSIVNAPNQSPTVMNFSGISPKGLLGSNDSVNVTIKVNMGPAKRYVDAFVPATDTVFVVWQLPIWLSVQKMNLGTFADVQKMNLAGGTGGDSVYQLTFKVKGKTHYNFMYTYRYKHINGNTVDQGGGLGAANPYITRFIRQSTPGVWPSSYTAPTDVWQKDAPLPGETAQFSTGIPEQPISAEPLIYKLYQNFPNPFNPSTTIRYSLPASQKVTLKVFNILGQEVATLVNEVQQKGNYVSVFEANNLASGVYFYRLEAGQFTSVQKMLLLK